MTTESQATSANVEPSSGGRRRGALAIKIVLLLVVFALAGLFVAQRMYHLGDESRPCASHTTAGIQVCRP